MNGQKSAKFVILGGGMVAGYAAKQLAELGLEQGQLAIVSADSAPPYERPPLSKGFLAGKDSEESVRINAQEFYQKHGIDLRLECKVSRVDLKGKRLVLDRGGQLAFEKLVIATGARPRTLNIPGARLANVFYLRSLSDSKAIRDAASDAKQALVIGGGFIGMEVAAVLAQKEIAVTMVLSDDRIWKRFFSPEMSKFFENYYTSRGVRLVKSTSVKEFRGNGSVSSALVEDGQSVSCDLVVAGIGVEPVTDFLAASGLQIENGVLVNEYLQTSHPDVFAAGDVANYQDLIFGKRRRVEHWDNAVSQGQYCARSLMGEKAPFKHVPYFFSDVFDLSYEYWGDSSGAEQIVLRGDVTTKSFSAWWLRQKRVVAAFTMNRPDEEREVAPAWIESHQAVSPEILQDESKSLLTAAAVK
ncbi:MAG TPA: FAD-dependent oxidoreductase [Terriglobales bacterium]|nr:FAD-dependent oxidoreductase [Terriglobales bacterium]